jgi:bacilliredoxin
MLSISGITGDPMALKVAIRFARLRLCCESPSGKLIHRQLCLVWKTVEAVIMLESFDLFIDQMRKEVKSLGATELRSPEEVDKTVASEGTTLVFVNSTCGCAGGIARPALSIALKEETLPDRITTVFAGQDRDATARARSYFTGQPPSSPSFALLKDGQLIKMIHRSDIEGRAPEEVAGLLRKTFREHC